MHDIYNYPQNTRVAHTGLRVYLLYEILRLLALEPFWRPLLNSLDHLDQVSQKNVAQNSVNCTERPPSFLFIKRVKL